VELATYPIGADLSIPGLRIRRALPLPGIRQVPIGFSLRKLALGASLALLVARLLLTRRYDVVHAVEEGVFLALPFIRRKRPLICDLDSLISDQLRYSGAIRNPWLLRAVRALEALALRRSAAAITVCRSLTDAARALCPGARIFQIEDAPLDESLREADLARVEALRDELGLRGRPIAVYTGNLEAYQGVELLIDAIERLAAARSDAACVLVGGDSASVAAFRERIRARGLERHVLAVGARPASEMPEWMALGDLLVSPRCEGGNTPLKLYTYMHAARPIVATALPTHTQVLDTSCAVLCEPNAEAMAAALDRVFRAGEALRPLAAAARARVELEFSPAAFARKLLAVYAELLGEVAPAGRLTAPSASM
jgi:glycosyltransferase involved in cell wall biosynthesis